MFSGTAALTHLYPLYNRPVAVVNDPYFWMRSDTRDDPEVLAYIESENRATRHAMKHTEELQKVRYTCAALPNKSTPH